MCDLPKYREATFLRHAAYLLQKAGRSLKERVGRFLSEGQPICTVETLANLEAEIAVTEQDVLRVRPGQEINLRARSLPFQTLNGRVERIAPRTPEAPDPNAAVPGLEGRGASAADLGKKPESVIIYCRLDGSPWGLQPGMTGYARIHCGRRPIGEILAFHVRHSCGPNSGGDPLQRQGRRRWGGASRGQTLMGYI